MALRFIDGFDHYGTNEVVLLGKWGSGSASPQATTPVRTGTHALRFPASSGQVVTKALPASGGVVVGVAVYATAAFAATDFLQVLEGATVHLAVAITAGGVLTVKRGTTVLATGSTVLLLNSWYYIEFLGVIDDAAGSYELRIDTVLELAAGPIDTRNAGATGQWDRIRLSGMTSAASSFCDDLYICDTSGAAPRNTFLGPCKIETLFPQTDAVAAGSNAGLTPSAGTDHGALVDEASPSSADYNASATVGAKDTYQYPALSLTGAVLGLQTNLYVNKTDAVARQVCAIVRTGGIDYDGANVTPTTPSSSYHSEVRAQNPNTANDWTIGEIASLEAGMKVTV